MMQNEQKFIVMNIGCIECGVSSNLVGVFYTESKANQIAEILNENAHWRQRGENRYEVYSLRNEEWIEKEYLEFIPAKEEPLT